MKDAQRNNVIIALLVVLASYAGVYFYAGPNYKTALENRNAQQSTLDATIAHIEQVNSLKTVLPDLQNSSSKILKNGMPTGDTWINLVEQVEQMMLSQNKFTVDNLNIPTTQAVKSTTNANEATFTMSVTGSLSDLEGLFKLINGNVRPMYVKSFSIVPTKATGVVNCSLTVATYVSSQSTSGESGSAKTVSGSTGGGE